jgi:hypothetical protein
MAEPATRAAADAEPSGMAVRVPVAEQHFVEYVVRGRG